MLIEKAKNKVVVGFEIADGYSQISFCRYEQSMPETISLVMGEEQYNIPMDGDVFATDEQLEAFIRKMLGFLEAYIGGDELGAIGFTMKELKTEYMERIKAIAATVFKKNTQVYFLNHEDCFFQYMIHQPEEMWIQDVLLFDYTADGIKSYLMSMNRKTSPVACFIESYSYPHMKLADLSNKTAEAREAYYKQLDNAFLEIARKQCEEKVITSIFLLGDGFTKQWCRESLKYMCRGRRVFQGNNLFSKGACYGARERTVPSTLSKSYVYLSDEKLKANVGMNCDKGQAQMYYPILDAGTSWFEANKSFDVMLVKGNSIVLNIVPIDGHVSRTAKISLEGLRVRGNKTNRVNLNFHMENPNVICLEVTDMGFGEFFPSTGQVWREYIPVGGNIDE